MLSTHEHRGRKAAQPYTHVVQPFAPVYDFHARVLILGSFPSEKSRENGFYYGHPQNRFWKVLAAIGAQPVPETIPEKTALLRRMRIALYDVIESCDIRGSGDTSIRNAVPADLSPILSACPIGHVYLNGQTAFRLYRKYHIGGPPCTCLPSTSPANAAFSLEKLVAAWRCIDAAAELQ